MKVRSLLLISIRFFNTVSIQTNQTISSTPLLLILLQTLLIFVGGKSYSCSRLDSLGWLQTVLNKNDQAPLRALSMLLPCTNSATTQNFGSVIARFHSNMEPSLTSELSFSDDQKAPGPQLLPQSFRAWHLFDSPGALVGEWLKRESDKLKPT